MKFFKGLKFLRKLTKNLSEIEKCPLCETSPCSCSKILEGIKVQLRKNYLNDTILLCLGVSGTILLVGAPNMGIFI